MINEIEKILSEYTPSDHPLFKDTVDKLCQNGIARSAFQDYDVLCDVLAILTICETIIKNKGVVEG